MGHPFRVRDIALQAGLSEATVDRVLNNRGGVRDSTAQEVKQAIEDLRRQRSQLRLGGRTFVVDVVVDSPDRFSAEVRAALESTLATLRPAVVRARFHFREAATPQSMVELLDGIGHRGSQGVILKASDLPDIGHAVDRLIAANIPVITLVTDLPTCDRLAYVGLDNRAAGATAAYLVEQWLGDHPGSVLVTRGDGSFRGEDEREMGFRGALRTLRPDRRQVDLLNPTGQDGVLTDLVRTCLDNDPSISAVYSMYAFGGNHATLDAFAQVGRVCRVFVAHDLDVDNRRLLADHRLSAVLHHDLREDVRRACQLIMQAHRALPGTPRSAHSAVQIVTPYNLPPALSIGRPADQRD